MSYFSFCAPYCAWDAHRVTATPRVVHFSHWVLISPPLHCLAFLPEKSTFVNGEKGPKGPQVVVLSGVCVFFEGGEPARIPPFRGLSTNMAALPTPAEPQTWWFLYSWSPPELETSPMWPLNVHTTPHQKTTFETPRDLAKTRVPGPAPHGRRRQKRLWFPTVRVLIIETSYERADFVVDNLFLYGPRRKHLAINQCFTPKIST